jgi:hypothetical protein
VGGNAAKILRDHIRPKIFENQNMNRPPLKTFKTIRTAGGNPTVALRSDTISLRRSFALSAPLHRCPTAI